MEGYRSTIDRIMTGEKYNKIIATKNTKGCFQRYRCPRYSLRLRQELLEAPIVIELLMEEGVAPLSPEDYQVDPRGICIPYHEWTFEMMVAYKHSDHPQYHRRERQGCWVAGEWKDPALHAMKRVCEHDWDTECTPRYNYIQTPWAAAQREHSLKVEKTT